VLIKKIVKPGQQLKGFMNTDQRKGTTLNREKRILKKLNSINYFDIIEQSM